ncbi:MAG TPA: M48 family metallopeptidase [Gemmatimonadales bacterium]|nr:M48 family metallopeptidase [Gemmatimonadales bacterium]
MPAPRDTTPVVAVPEPTELALRYHAGNHWVWAADTALDLAVPAALLFTGLSARVRTFARRLARGRGLPTIAIYAVLFVLLTSLVYFPFTWYFGFVRQHAYGLSNQTSGRWLGDYAKAALVGAVVAALVLWIPYRLLRASPQRWWLWTGLATLPIATLGLLVGPVWIAPLFDRFGPMHDRALESRILSLAERAGIEGGRVYEVDKSRDTRLVNAYVTGIGATKRIVLWDTLLERLEPDEVVFVMGHEMGHYVLHHTLAIILGTALVATLALYAVHRVAGGLIARHRERFGFDELADVASLPLLMLVGGLVSFVVTPGALAYSRWQEREADRFGLELAGNRHAAAMAFVRLQQENLGVPRPGLLYTLWRGSHPSLASRIEFANAFDVEGRGSKVEGRRPERADPRP